MLQHFFLSFKFNFYTPYLLYLEIVILGLLTLYTFLDLRTRTVPVYLFVFPFVAILVFKIINNDIDASLILFGIQALFVIPVYVMRFFSAGDMFGMLLVMLLVMFAVPSVGPFPTVIVLVAAIVLQSNGSLLSNIWYNLVDVAFCKRIDQP